MQTLKIAVRIEQHERRLPAFVVIPARALSAWELTGTTTVEASLDGVALGRRSLRPGDDGRWFVELRREQFVAVGKAPGDRATITLARVSDELPQELAHVIETDPTARANWEKRTDAQRRMLREDVLAAKTPATRERRARRALVPEVAVPRARAVGLPSEPRAVRVRILARDLPGQDCGPYSDIAVGLVQRAGEIPDPLTPADARAAAWETTIEVRDVDGVPAFRGPGVHGPAAERFLYLTWIGREGRTAPAMFRRAKLRLDAIAVSTLAAAARSGVLVGSLGLTDARGMPVCASVRPPAIEWRAGE